MISTLEQYNEWSENQGEYSECDGCPRMIRERGDYWTPSSCECVIDDPVVDCPAIERIFNI